MAKVKKEVEEKDVLPTVLESDEKVSRRKIITAGAAVALGAAITAALPGVASAADGDPMLIGGHNLGNPDTGQETHLWSNAIDYTLWVKNSAVNQDGILGEGYRGVVGLAETARLPGDGNFPRGVHGEHWESPTTANAFGIGVEGNSNVGVGVIGSAGGYPSSLGSRSENQVKGTGVLAVGKKAGLRAESKGRALDVKGKAHFSNSGHTHIGRGHMYKTFRSRRLNISKNALILVTLQGSAGPSVVVQYAKRVSRYAFKVYLNKKAKKKAKLAFFIIN